VLREELSRTRGAAREPLLERLAPIEHDLLAQARHAVASDRLRDFTSQAEQELAPYRDRLPPEQWARAVSVTVDRSVRDHLALPVLEL